MTCDEIRPHIELFVLAGLDPAAEAAVREHLAVCPGCRQVELECRQIVGELKRAAPQPPVREGFVASLRQAVAGEVRAERRRAGRRRIVPAAAAAAAAVLAAVGVWRALPTADDGPQAPTPGPPAAVGAEQWRHVGASAEPTSSADSVVVHGGSMYFLRSRRGGERVAAIDLASGRPRWESPADSIGYLSADDSRVYCLAAGGRRRIELLSMDASSGALRWRYGWDRTDLLSPPSRPVPLGGGRIAWAADGTVHVIDASTGRAVWRQTVADGSPVSEVAGDKACLYVAAPGSLCCLDGDSGRPVWRMEVSPGDGRRRPLLALNGDTAYLAMLTRAGTGVLESVDLPSRQVRWRVPVGDVRHILATAAGVFVRGGDVRAYGAHSGQRLWARPVAGCGPMTVHRELLYLVDSGGDGRLLALDQAGGGEAWRMEGVRSCDGLRRVGRIGYVKTQDGVIHAIALLTH